LPYDLATHGEIELAMEVGSLFIRRGSMDHRVKPAHDEPG
jgi:hypothetical protein